ncbi:MAG: MBOAT family protein [Bacteroidetes bacterium]|nr:MBOAT family protein [Bacteroidota bacterium]
MFQLDLDKLLSLLTYNPKEPLIFSTGLFLFMFMCFITVFYMVHKKHDLKLVYVTLFSYYFYYKSSGIYFLLLLGSTVIDYNLATAIYKSQRPAVRKGLLIFSLVLNLGLLGYFKYTNFFYSIFCDIANRHFDPFHIFLPVGVSFFTFQSLSYTIDIYRKEIKPVDRILDYAFFVSFFPQLVAGPIVRAKDFIPQISLPTIVTRAMFGEGVFLIASGLFKKAVISDYISINFVDRIFDNPTLYTGLENLFGVYGYALQIYCDFSGYSDMAIGIALLFGYRLCLNFDSPYQSSSITEFWRRWHISLSTWLRDYLYISLGGNRNGKLNTYINQFITMLLGGLWHGASPMFILWGALHGVALGIDKYIKSIIRIPDTKRIKFLGVLFTFHFVCFCWIFFRASSMQVAGGVISQIALHFTPSIFMEFVTGYSNVLLIMLLGYILHFVPKPTEWKVREWVTDMPLPAKVAMLVAVIVIVIQFKSSEIQPFIYFQF